MDKSRCEICKVFVVKNSRSTYYVQRMPKLYGDGMRYVVMKDRKRLFYTDYCKEKEAVLALLSRIENDYRNQIDLF